jgi:mercuric ion transport protein
MKSEQNDSTPGTTLPLVGAVVAAVICCAGPTLVAGGALVAVGGFLRNPVVIAVAAFAVASAVGYAVRRYRADPASRPRRVAEQETDALRSRQEG